MFKVDHTGKKVGNTTILSYLRQDSTGSVWLALCGCGKTREVQSSKFSILRKGLACRCSRKGRVKRVAKEGERLCLRCERPVTVNRYYHSGCLALMNEKYDGSDYGYNYVG